MVIYTPKDYEDSGTVRVELSESNEIPPHADSVIASLALSCALGNNAVTCYTCFSCLAVLLLIQFCNLRLKSRIYFNLRVGRRIALFPSTSRATMSFLYNNTIKITLLPTLPQEVLGD